MCPGHCSWLVFKAVWGYIFKAGPHSTNCKGRAQRGAQRKILLAPQTQGLLQTSCTVRSPFLQPRTDLSGAALQWTQSWEALVTPPVLATQLTVCRCGYSKRKSNRSGESSTCPRPHSQWTLVQHPWIRQLGGIARLGSCPVSFSTLSAEGIALNASNSNVMRCLGGKKTGIEKVIGQSREMEPACQTYPREKLRR